MDSESNHFQVCLPSSTIQKRLVNALHYDLVLSDEKAKTKKKGLKNVLIGLCKYSLYFEFHRYTFKSK